MPRHENAKHCTIIKALLTFLAFVFDVFLFWPVLERHVIVVNKIRLVEYIRRSLLTHNCEKSGRQIQLTQYTKNNLRQVDGAGVQKMSYLYLIVCPGHLSILTAAEALRFVH